MHERIVPQSVDWTPKAGLPPGGREECKNGERPCPYVRCKWHLWLVIGEDRRGRRWDGTAPPTTLIPAWLEYPTPPCCGLDVREAIRDSRAPVKMIAEAMHLSRTAIHIIIGDALKVLRNDERARELFEAMVAA